MQKIVLAIVNHELSPYRIHMLKRLVAELPELEIHTYLMNSVGTAAWAIRPPAEFNHVDLGEEGDLKQCTTIWRVLRHVRPQYRKGRRLLSRLNELNPSVLLVFAYSDLAHVMAILWARRRGIPVLLFGDSNVLGDRARGVKRFLKNILLRKLIKRCDALLPCGSLGAQYFQRYGAPNDRIFKMPLEPDYQMIATLPRQAVEELSRSFSLGHGRKRLVFSGRLVPVKRVDLLLQAFGRIAQRRPNWDLVIVGGGPLEAQLRQVVDPAWQHRVIWTGFFATQDKVTAVYHLADVLVLPSDYEPWAVVVCEAAAAGLALVCSDVVGAAAELVRDGENGRIFRSGDVNSLTDALLDVTDETRLSQYKAMSPHVVKHWRQVADPIDGLRSAMNRCGIQLSQTGSSQYALRQ